MPPWGFGSQSSGEGGIGTMCSSVHAAAARQLLAAVLSSFIETLIVVCVFPLLGMPPKREFSGTSAGQKRVCTLG